MTETATTVRAPRAREGEEIWETTTDGLVWVPIVDSRGREKNVKVGGKQGSRLRISTEDRELAEERFIEVERSPFRNGLLSRIDSRKESAEPVEGDQGLTTEQLMAGFAKNGNAFQAFVNGLNELNQRRMLEMAGAVDASVAQQSFLQETVAKYRPMGEGAQPSYVEMQRRGEVG